MKTGTPRVFFGGKMLKTATALFVVLGSVPALASPSECFSGRGWDHFWTGYSNRSLDLAEVWHTDFDADCSYQEDFENIYSSYMSETGPLSRRCRNAGRNLATQEYLDEVYTACDEMGTHLGAQDGHALGLEYCGDRNGCGPGEICAMSVFDYSYEESCASVYTRYVQRNCPDKVGSSQSFANKVQTDCDLGG